MKIYKKREKRQGVNFHLIGVIQGNTPQQYLNCYKKMQILGYKHIAVGGLLQKISNSARYTKVEDEQHLYKVFKKFASMILMVGFSLLAVFIGTGVWNLKN